MIQISVLDAGTGPVARLETHVIANSQYPYIGIESLTASASRSRSANHDVITQGKKAWGELREKAVTHAKIAADLTIQGTTHVFSTQNQGYNLKTTGNQLVFVDDLFLWGDTRVSTRTASWYYANRNQDILETHSWFFVFNADGFRAAFIDVRESSVYNHANGSFLSKSYSKRIRGIRRPTIGGPVYLTMNSGVVSASGTYTPYTSSEISTYVAGPSIGGSLISASNYQTYGSTYSDAQLDFLISEIKRKHTFSGLDLDIHPVDFGDLAVECAAQLKYVDSNLLGNIFDILDYRNFVGSCKDLLSTKTWTAALRAYKLAMSKQGSPKDIISMMKPFTSGYLFSKYAVLTSVSDIRSLMSGAEKFSQYLRHQRLHSRRITSATKPPYSQWKHTAVLTVQCNRYPSGVTDKIQEAIGEAKKWGAWPEISNLWDRLQYSFVLDWIVQFGDFFDQCNTYMDMKWYFPIQFVVCSEKWVGSRVATDYLPGYPVTGTVDSVYYVRWISREIPLPSVSLHAESQLDKHLVESTALVLQRM